jgi:hypothetical protein
MALEMARRIRPIANKRWFVLKWFDVMATGTSHALAATMIGMPLITANIKPDGCLAPLDLEKAFFVAAVVLAIGFIANIIWEEKPVTEPL